MNIRKIVLASIFAAVLALSVVSSVSNASALSAATITSKPTFSSLTSGKWQRVWTNTGGIGTYFVDANAGSFKSVLVNNTGSIVSTASSALVGAPVTVTSLTASTTRTDTMFTQNVGGTTQNLNNAGTTFVTEYAATSGSQLVGKTVNSITLWIKKTGAPTGTATFAVFDSSGNTITSFGTQDVSLLTTSFVQTTYTSTTVARAIANGDRIGVFFNGGSAGNSLDVEYSAADSFDGTTNTIVSTGTGAQGSAVYTSQITREVRMSLAYVYGASNVNLGTFNSAELFENRGQIIRAVQSDDGQEASLRSGSITEVGEKAATSSALILSSSYDTLQLRLKKTGSPTETITAGVFDSSGVLQATFGTMSAASLTTSYATYTFQSSSAISIALNQYVGISFAGGSVGNTVEISGSSGSQNPYDGTNSVWSQFNAGWSDNTGVDVTFRLT